MEAARATIPLPCDWPSGEPIPGWSEQVQPLRNKTLFWHRLYTDHDRPHLGVVTDCKRRIRVAHYYVVRKIK